MSNNRSKAAPACLMNACIVDVCFAANVTVIEPVNIYGCEIGEGVFVGPFVEIQRSVIIGARTRIQSHTFICELVSIGEDCFVSHGVMFVNDEFACGTRAGGRRELLKSTHIGARVLIGSNATILPVRVCDDVVVGAGSVVTRNIEKPGIYAGNPARFLRASKKD